MLDPILQAAQPPGYVPVILVGQDGEEISRLRLSALDLAAQADREALTSDITKTASLAVVLRSLISEAGFMVNDDELRAAVRKLQAVRRGDEPDFIAVRTYHSTPVRPLRPMPAAVPKLDSAHFEATRSYPNLEAQEWYDSLVGLDVHKRDLLVELELLLYPDRVEAWALKHHGQPLRAARDLSRRVPLVIFQGDVGTGKTALAETVGDALVRHVNRDHAARRTRSVHLLKVNTQVRGSGLVGEMSLLVSSAFNEAERFADTHPGEPVLLLIDEADALAASRETAQMHHEDRAGLNTLIQRLDNLRLGDRRLAALFITNRPDALDPAVRRRAALVLHFERPSDEARKVLINARVPELKLKPAQVNELVRLTGADGDGNDGVPFTASDLTDRLFPDALRSAFGEKRPLCYEDLVTATRNISPAPRFCTQ